MNGVHVPCPSVSISYGIWQIPQATLSFPPHRLLQRLGHEDRVEVAVFYLDTLADPEDPSWRLIFEGDIVSSDYSSSPHGRQMNFRAIGDISIWTQLHYFFMNNVDTVSQAVLQNVVVSGVYQPGAFYPFSLFKKGLLIPPAGAATYSGDTEALRKKLDLAQKGLSYYDWAAQPFLAATNRFKDAEEVLAIKGKGSSAEWLEHSLAKSALAVATKNWEKTRAFTWDRNKILKTIAELKTALGLDETKPESPDIERPYELIFNVVRGMLDTNIPAKQRVIPATNFFARWARKRNFINRFVALPVFEDEGRPSVFPILDSVNATNAFIVSGEDSAASVGHLGTLFQVIQELLTRFCFELAMIPTPPCVRVNMEDGKILGPSSTPAAGPQEPLRLANYFAKPQMFFSVPPACNAIFPSMFTSYSYGEEYRDQPTRTYANEQFTANQLKGQFVPPCLTAAWPEEVSVIMQQRAGDEDSDTAPNPAQNGKNVLAWPEELYKGPVVSRVAVPAWFTHLAKHTEGSSKGGEESENTKRVQRLFGVYTKYEHYRSRYEKRGGSLNLAFNPYILPGFPCAVFDNRAHAFDTIGYVTQVTQQLSVGGFRTAVQYSFGRTFQEMIGQLRQDVARSGVFQASAPAEPVPIVRYISQDFSMAEEFYGALFFGRKVPSTKRASFDFRKIVGYVSDQEYGETTVEPIQFEAEILEKTVSNAEIARLLDEIKYTKELIKTREAAYERIVGVIEKELAEIDKQIAANGDIQSFDLGLKRSSAKDSLKRAQKDWEDHMWRLWDHYPEGGPPSLEELKADVKEKEERIAALRDPRFLPVVELDDSREVGPMPEARPLFESYDAAMRYVSRPICTLQEYITFMHGKPADSLDLRDQVEGRNNEFAYDKDKTSGATYYTRIRRLRQGPGVRPSPAALGAVVNEKNEATPHTGALEGLPVDYPQTRQDWDTMLMAYRAEILGEAPQR